MYQEVAANVAEHFDIPLAALPLLPVPAQQPRAAGTVAAAAADPRGGFDGGRMVPTGAC